MEKQKAVMQVSAIGNVEKRYLIELSTKDAAVFGLVRSIAEKCRKKYGGYMQIEVSPPYKKRTTGELSQNNLIWWLITLIANEKQEGGKE